jgi:hypothetical protein
MLKDLHSQLQKALTDNSHLDQRLKNEHQAAIMQKQKELSDACQEAAAANQQLDGCRAVINYMHTLLLGNDSLVFCISASRMFYMILCYIAAMQLHLAIRSPRLH